MSSIARRMRRGGRPFRGTTSEPTIPPGIRDEVQRIQDEVQRDVDDTVQEYAHDNTFLLMAARGRPNAIGERLTRILALGHDEVVEQIADARAAGCDEISVTDLSHRERGREFGLSEREIAPWEAAARRAVN
jgi:hypothetical protein